MAAADLIKGDICDSVNERLKQNISLQELEIAKQRAIMAEFDRQLTAKDTIITAMTGKNNEYIKSLDKLQARYDRFFTWDRVKSYGLGAIAAGLAVKLIFFNK